MPHISIGAGLSAGGVANGDLEVTQDLTVDTNTLYVDSANNRVGILNVAPKSAVEIGNVSDASTVVTIQAGTGTAEGGILSFERNDVVVGQIGCQAKITGGDVEDLSLYTDNEMYFYSGTVEAMGLDYLGSMRIGQLWGEASAKLEIVSTTRGFLPPKMTTAQRDAISSPAEGLVIYNTSTNVLNFHNGTAWGAV